MFIKGKKTIIFILILAILLSLTSGITASTTKTLVFVDHFANNKANPKVAFRFSNRYKIENEKLHIGFNVDLNDWERNANASE